MMNKKKSPTLKLAKYLLIVPLFFLFVAANSIYAAQNEEKPVAAYDLPDPPPEKKKEEIHMVVDVLPEFPGGIEGLTQFLSSNIRYPREAQEKKIQGRVICRFTVKSNGTIDSVKVVRGVEGSLDEEAMRVLRSMPAWKPGELDGKAVNVWFTMPIVFRLSTAEPSEAEKTASQEKTENLEKAEFPGGESAYNKYLANNVRYPVIAQENGIQGHVSAVFNVNSTGKVTFVRFEKGIDPSLDAEVKRVIENMPEWIPAKLNGEPTSMTTGVDFVFRLQGEDVEEYKGPMPENAIVVVGYGKQKEKE